MSSFAFHNSPSAMIIWRKGLLASHEWESHWDGLETRSDACPVQWLTEFLSTYIPTEYLSNVQTQSRDNNWWSVHYTMIVADGTKQRHGIIPVPNTCHCNVRNQVDLIWICSDGFEWEGETSSWESFWHFGQNWWWVEFNTISGIIIHNFRWPSNGLGKPQYHVHHHHHHHHHHHYRNHQATLASTPALSPDLREWTTECRFNLIIASSTIIKYLDIFKYLKGPTTILTILLINGRCLHNDHCLFQPPLTGDVPHAWRD